MPFDEVFVRLRRIGQLDGLHICIDLVVEVVFLGDGLLSQSIVI